MGAFVVRRARLALGDPLASALDERRQRRCEPSAGSVRNVAAYRWALRKMLPMGRGREQGRAASFPSAWQSAPFADHVICG